MHIHKFPSEIILMVFYELYDSLDFRRAVRRKMAKPELKWMRIQAVCRRWRDLIQDTPSYWSVINVYNAQGWLNLCLTRSAGKKTQTSVYFRKFNFPASLLQPLSLRSYAPYVRLLSFNVDEELFDPLHRLFSQCFPNLSTLQLECPTDKMWMPQKPFTLPPHTLPRLKNLTLYAARPPEDLGLYSNLRVLEITAFPWDVPWDSFLGVLNACAPTLERLGLVHVPCEMTLRPDLYSGPSPIIFPRLSTIHVANKRPYLARILSHLRAPLITDVYLMDNLAGVHDQVISTLEQVFVPMLPPNLADIIPKMSSIKAVRFTAWQAEYAFVGRGMMGTQVELELFRHAKEPLVWGDLARKGLVELLGLLSGADVRRFEIAVDYSTVDTGGFEAVFRAFPNLETLILNGGGDFDYVLHLLARDARPPSSASLSGSADERSTGAEASRVGGSRLWCPNLKALVIGDVDEEWKRDDNVLDEILRVLRTRAARGSRLVRFEIHLTHDTDEEYQEASAKYIPRFQELVGEVVYENHKPHDDSDCDTCESDDSEPY